jgi:tripartite-type tricarboxylate transporter receptor subunit TctC
VLQKPDVRDKLRSFGSEPAGGSAQELGAFIAEERIRWKRAVEFSRSK